ncbi:MAG TPA: glycosyltransferase family 39 protein [Polyangiales bacterium]
MSWSPARVALYAAFMLAVVLRVPWLDYDLPQAPDIDGFKFVDEAQRMAQTGDLRPTDFQYPTGYTYLLTLGDRALGLQTAYTTHLAARSVSVFFGVATLWLLARWALAIAGPWAAAVAVALVGFSPVHVAMSRTVAPDTMLTFWWSVGCWALLRADPTRRRQLFGGACFGLATATKLSGLYALGWLPLVVFACSPRGTRAGKRIVSAGAALLTAIVAFVVVDPWIVPLRREYIQRFRMEMILQSVGQVGHVQLGYFDYFLSGTRTPELPWLSTSLFGDLGQAALLLVAGVLAALIRRKQAWRPMAALYALGFLVAVSAPGHIKALRLVLPVLPVLGLLAGMCVAEWLERPWSVHMRRLLYTALLVTLCVPLLNSADYVRRLAYPSSVARFREYAATHLPPGSTIFVEPFSLGDLRSLAVRVVELKGVGSRAYGLPRALGPNPERNPLVHGDIPDQLLALGVEYLVLHSYFEDALSATPDNLRWFPRSVANRQSFDDAVERTAERVHLEPGFASGGMGPEISVWRLRESKPKQPATQSAP